MRRLAGKIDIYIYMYIADNTAPVIVAFFRRDLFLVEEILLSNGNNDVFPTFINTSLISLLDNTNPLSNKANA